MIPITALHQPSEHYLLVANFVISYSRSARVQNHSRRIPCTGIKRFVIEAPRIARKQRPGQFVILRIYEEGERIPVTIENSDPDRGTINIGNPRGRLLTCSIRWKPAIRFSTSSARLANPRRLKTTARSS